jgi:GNAT superfamily N-acetyltransferase
MLTYQREPLFDSLEGIKQLVQAHHDEVTVDHEQVKLDPQWAQYVAIENAGMLHVFTVRDGPEMVGYASFIVTPHLHHASVVAAINDALYLLPAYRKGWAGARLIAFAEDELRKIGAHKMTIHVSPRRDFSHLLARMGYAEEERVMSKLFQGA